MPFHRHPDGHERDMLCACRRPHWERCGVNFGLHFTRESPSLPFANAERTACKSKELAPSRESLFEFPPQLLSSPLPFHPQCVRVCAVELFPSVSCFSCRTKPLPGQLLPISAWPLPASDRSAQRSPVSLGESKGSNLCAGEKRKPRKHLPAGSRRGNRLPRNPTEQCQSRCNSTKGCKKLSRSRSRQQQEEQLLQELCLHPSPRRSEGARSRPVRRRPPTSQV